MNTETAIDPAPQSYKDVQRWAKERKRLVGKHRNAHKPGHVLQFSDGKRYLVGANGAHVFVGSAPEVEAPA